MAIMEREARATREPQALQATEKTRRAARTARRSRAKDHEGQQSKRGESNASMKIASVGGSCEALARALRALAGRLRWERFVYGRAFSVLSRLASCEVHRACEPQPHKTKAQQRKPKKNSSEDLDETGREDAPESASKII